MHLRFKQTYHNVQQNNMKLFTKQTNKGFTLIETMIAVFILVVAFNGLLGLIANSIYYGRYSKNDIVANYLVQEVLDSIRNERDTIAFQKIAEVGSGWSGFLAKYGYPNSYCFSANGCEIEVASITTDISACSGSAGSWGTLGCRILNYDEKAINQNFYTYKTPQDSVPSNFKRKINMSINPSLNDQLDITVSVEWLNGTLVRSKTLRTSLLNWQRL